MSLQPSSEPQAPVTAPESTTAPAPAPDAVEPGRIYTSAEQRAAILARTGAEDMGAFHPSVTPRETAPPPEPSVGAAPTQPSPEQPPAPEAPTVPTDVAAELAAMRAEVAALRAPETDAPEPDKGPVHPLEAHARSVLGDGAQPHHVERAVGLLEQGMQWRSVIAHHEANPTDAAPAEKAKAQRALDTLQRQIQDMAEQAKLHAELTELRTAQATPKPEERAKARAADLDRVLADAAVMGQHHPNLHRALSTNTALAGQVKAYLMSLPDDDKFQAQGNAYLHSLDAAFTAPAAAAQPSQQPPAQPAAQELAMPRIPSTAPEIPGERYPIRPITPGSDQQPVSKREFWERVHNGFAARGQA